MDCGATCLRMICRYYGRNISIHKLRQLCQSTRSGINLLGISEAAEKIGFRTQGARLSLERLAETSLPCILHWRQNHFVVLYKVRKDKYYIADPAMGHCRLSQQEFLGNWFAYRGMHQGLMKRPMH